MATYVVGDIQGCYDPLQRLLEEIRFDPASDRLFCTGDLVNRGGKSLKTLRLLRSLDDRFVATLGNHDLFLLREHYRLPLGNSRNREIRKILQAPERMQLIDWLQNQPMALYEKASNVLLLHAGVIPQWTLQQVLSHAAEVEQAIRGPKAEKFFRRMRKIPTRRWRDDLGKGKRRRLITDILTRIRFCDAHGKILTSASGPPGSAPAPYLPWFMHPHRQTRDTTIVFGHWAALGLHLGEEVIGLDSGCVWGGQLTALRLEDRQIFQVPGKTRKRRR
jgi:bis(5'-nucleosyl)-tetraphosphatase (symmetrical)